MTKFKLTDTKVNGLQKKLVAHLGIVAFTRSHLDLEIHADLDPAETLVIQNMIDSHDESADEIEEETRLSTRGAKRSNALRKLRTVDVSGASLAQLRTVVQDILDVIGD